MNKKIIVASVATLALGAGAWGLTAVADDTPSPSPSTSVVQGEHGQDSGRGKHEGRTPGTGQGGHGGKGQGDQMGQSRNEIVTKLASKLGVDEPKMRDALQSIRPQSPDNRPTTPPTDAEHQARQKEHAAALAKALGIDEAKVAKALEEIKAERDATREAGLKTRLDQAVKDGLITQGDADSVLKAAKAHVIGFGDHGGGKR